MMSFVKKTLSISELKKAPSKMIDEAKRTREPVAIVRNNVIEGYYTPASALEFESISDEEFHALLVETLDEYGGMFTALSNQ